VEEKKYYFQVSFLIALLRKKKQLKRYGINNELENVNNLLVVNKQNNVSKLKIKNLYTYMIKTVISNLY
jgi:hypothetical protein